MNHPGRSPSRQSGASLVLGLMLLLIMTLLGLTAANSNLLQARTDANRTIQSQARSAALNALQQAESWLAAADAATLDGDCALLCGSPVEIDRGNPDRWTAAAAAGSDPVTGAVLQPWPAGLPETRFYLSQLHTETVVSAAGAATIYYYRIRAASRLYETWTVVESIVARTPTDPGPCTAALARGYRLDPVSGEIVAVNAGLPRCGRQAFRVVE